MHRWNGVQHGRKHLAVVLVGRTDHYAERGASSVNRDVALAAIHRVRPGCSFPLRWNRRGVRRGPTPVDLPGGVQALQRIRCNAAHTLVSCQSRSLRQQLLPDPQHIPAGSISYGKPDLSTNRMPTRRGPVWQMRSAASRLRRLRQQQRRNDHLRVIGDEWLGHAARNAPKVGFVRDFNYGSNQDAFYCNVVVALERQR